MPVLELHIYTVLVKSYLSSNTPMIINFLPRCSKLVSAYGHITECTHSWLRYITGLYNGRFVLQGPSSYNLMHSDS